MSTLARRSAGPPALRMLEEAVVLLRHTPPALWLGFYAGSVPFWLALLHFISEMSRSAFAKEHLLGGSLVVALLYLWKKCWHAAVAEQWRARLLAEPPPHWTLTRCGRLFMVQTALQPWGLLLRPLAWLLVLPFALASGFFQQVTAGGPEPAPALRALRQTLRWPWQLYALYGTLALSALVVWLNLGLALGVLPSLLKILLGLETMASRSESAWLGDATFPLVVTALACLVMDPLWKAIFVLRSFYGEALATGADLQAALRSSRRLALLLFTGLSLFGPALPAAEPAQLDRHIDQVLQRRAYAWRLPRGAEAREKAPSWLEEVRGWCSRQRQRFRDWMKSGRTVSTQGGSALPAAKEVLYALLGLLMLVLLWAVWLAWQRRGARVEVAPALAALPDLESDSVLASALPEDGWLRLMRELLERGDLRLALRAAWLGCLAQLGERQLLAIARHKSNRDYWLELRRRGRAREGLLPAFSENLEAFERVWYGQAGVSREELARFSENTERMRAC